MPNLRIFGEDIVALLDAMTDKWVRQLFCGRNKKFSNDQIKVATQNINAKCIACEFSVKRDVTFGDILYRNQ